MNRSRRVRVLSRPKSSYNLTRGKVCLRREKLWLQFCFLVLLCPHGDSNQRPLNQGWIEKFVSFFFTLPPRGFEPKALVGMLTANIFLRCPYVAFVKSFVDCEYFFSLAER